MKKLFLALFLILCAPAMAQAAASLTLTWVDNSNNEAGFKVYRGGVITGPFNLLATVISTPAEELATGRIVTYIDGNLPYNTQFCYQVTAFNTAGESTPVGPICATTAPAPNVSPTVNAGPDQTIILPGLANLSGTASDDGQPSPLVTTWSKVSGPGTVTFGNANAVNTTASFSVAGTYVLQLTANDGALSVTDTVTITVNPAPVVVPMPPLTLTVTVNPVTP